MNTHLLSTNKDQDDDGEIQNTSSGMKRKATEIMDTHQNNKKSKKPQDDHGEIQNTSGMKRKAATDQLLNNDSTQPNKKAKEHQDDDGEFQNSTSGGMKRKAATELFNDVTPIDLPNKKAKNHQDDELPDLVVHKILSLFTTAIGSRLRIISKQWHRLWSSIPVIDLDEFNGDQQQPSIEIERKDPRENFMKFVERCFELREKDFAIERFRLRMRYLEGAHDRKIHKWLLFALKGKMLQELDLRLVTRYELLKDPNEELDGESDTECPRLHLEPDILRTAAKSLTILKLENVIIKPRSIDLPSLKIMSLKYVEFRTGLSSKPCSLLSRCPSIEDLSLSCCYTCEQGKKIKLSSPTLKSLQLMGLTPTIISKLEAVNLEALTIHSHFNNIPFMKRGKHWKKLKTLEFGHVDQLKGSWFQDLDSRAPLLESLTLHGCCLPQFKHLHISIQRLKRFVLFSNSSTGTRLSTDFPNLLEAVVILITKDRHNSTSKWRFDRLMALEKIRCSTTTSVRLHVPEAEDLLCPTDLRTTYPPPFLSLENLEVNISSTIPEKDIVLLMDSLHWMAPSLKSKSPSVKQNSSKVLLDYSRRADWD